jgi:PPK2 family polyphosphate:nucleotide phosphotransferase
MLKLPADIVRKYRVGDGGNFKLAKFDPGDTCGLDVEKDNAKPLLQSGAKRLAKLQERLYAEDRWAILVILQGLDTAGKDGVIEHVMSGINPMGCEVHSFKAPSERELDHDFLWRTTVVLPRRGYIGIFNRSYYEEVLVVRAHPKILNGQRLPSHLVTDAIWKERYEDINAFERHLARNGTLTLKFFLHLSPEEQRKRLLARIDDPDKRWKFNVGDLAERKLWDKYQTAYEEAIRATSTAEAPWYVVPADNKWFTRLVVGAAMVEQIEALNPQYPVLDAAELRELEAARATLSD